MQSDFLTAGGFFHPRRRGSVKKIIGTYMFLSTGVSNGEAQPGHARAQRALQATCQVALPAALKSRCRRGASIRSWIFVSWAACLRCGAAKTLLLPVVRGGRRGEEEDDGEGASGGASAAAKIGRFCRRRRFSWARGRRRRLWRGTSLAKFSRPAPMWLRTATFYGFTRTAQEPSRPGRRASLMSAVYLLAKVVTVAARRRLGRDF